MRGSASGLRLLDPKRLLLLWAALRDLVADYEQVVVYAEANEVRRRFPSRRGDANLLVLEPDPLLIRYGRVAPRCQVYADLFNLPTWQAQRFLEALDRTLLRDVA